MESSPNNTKPLNPNNPTKDELPRINIIGASAERLSSHHDNLSYLSDYHVFQQTSPKTKTNNNNINYYYSNNNFNNSFDSDFSGNNNSFNSCKTPRSYSGFEQFTSQLVYDNVQPNNQDNINYLNPNIPTQQCCTINNNNNNANNNCHYSSFSPLRPQIKTKPRYSSHNLTCYNNNNMNGNFPFLVHTKSNTNLQNKNFLPSTFSTCVRANSNTFHHSSNSLLNVIQDNQGMLYSPMISPNTSSNNLMVLGSPQNNQFVLRHQNKINEREYHTPQAPKKGEHNILHFRGSGAINDNNNNNIKKSKKTKEMKNDNNNRDIHNTSSNSSSHLSKKQNLDIPRNKIHLESILRQKDKRTTIMIRHIPNKYTLKLFSDEINSMFMNKYDLLYLPVDSDNHCNLGFGFINFIDPIHIILFYDKYYGKKWEKFNSDKICELAYAKIQGKEELLKHIQQNGNHFNIDMPVYLTYDITKEQKKNVSIELPMKFLQTFLNFYSYSLYRVVNQDKFIVDSFYNF